MLGEAGEIVRALTSRSLRPLLTTVQLRPLFVLRKTPPPLVAANSVLVVVGSITRSPPCS